MPPILLNDNDFPTMDELERRYVLHVLKVHRGNKSEAIRAMIAYQRREAPELLNNLRVLPAPTYAERLAGMSRRNPRFCDTEPGDDPYWVDGERASLWGRRR